MSDPISDMLTRLRNAQVALKQSVEMPSSKLKLAVADVLRDEGYISEYAVTQDIKPTLTLYLKYHNGHPVIQKIRRVSRPGLRVYKRRYEIPAVLGGLGVAILSTSKGVMSDRKARALGHGGEILCFVE